MGGNSVHKGPQIKNGARRHVEWDQIWHKLVFAKTGEQPLPCINSILSICQKQDILDIHWPCIKSSSKSFKKIMYFPSESNDFNDSLCVEIYSLRKMLVIGGVLISKKGGVQSWCGQVRQVARVHKAWCRQRPQSNFNWWDPDRQAMDCICRFCTERFSPQNIVTREKIPPP